MPLLRSKISPLRLTLDPVLNEDYHTAKLGKLTSSDWHYLMGGDSVANHKPAMNYIYRKVGEELTGTKSKPDITTLATEHGLDYELEGLEEFRKLMTLSEEMKPNAEIREQELILDADGRTGGTPDGLWVISEKEDSLTVRTAEIKCPVSFDGYIRLFRCKSPQDVLKVSTEGVKYYWQVLHQMHLCGSLFGYLIAYHPFFRVGKIKVITFNSQDKDILENLKKVAARKIQAIEIFNQVREEIMTQ